MSLKSDINSEISTRLEEIQSNLGYTQEQMAELMGISKEQYRKYLRDGSGIPLYRLSILFSNEQIDIKYLVTGVREEEKTFSEHLSSMTKEGRTKYLRGTIDYFAKRLLKE